MEAILSGVSETAFFVDGERLFSIHLEDPEKQIPRSPHDVAHFLRGSGRLLSLRDVTIPSAMERLRLLSDEECVLDLALMILDPELSAALREETAVVLEKMLDSVPLLTFLENLLFSRPFPADALGEKALAVCPVAQLPHVVGLLRRLLDLQTEIKQVFG